MKKEQLENYFLSAAIGGLLAVAVRNGVNRLIQDLAGNAPTPEQQQRARLNKELMSEKAKPGPKSVRYGV
jgi:hypothetical protein